jgi:hypothetical protein
VLAIQLKLVLFIQRNLEQVLFIKRNLEQLLVIQRNLETVLPYPPSKATAHGAVSQIQPSDSIALSPQSGVSGVYPPPPRKKKKKNTTTHLM